MLHFEHHFYKVLAHTQSNIAGNNFTSNIGSKGKLAVKLGTTYPLDKLRIVFLDTFNRDHKKLKSFLIQVKL